ncbi:uncharacterized protein LOC111705089 isoform X2 [Eurytemora carolleeae]|uniref:uncharacterized protein LOC111705089 isoform X2 n=1 Tax=Eurytemora carolleeae TaxID=1294199 RepID=UPI000C75E2DE|nr:uncharacterized protein LOC111705089 isoform X2 [Eurytemora carolleeae]|eukprot:XP_023333299.1 uncharacterized protein LOC111705089 isoform X2 [Eurytemora affinis]
MAMYTMKVILASLLFCSISASTGDNTIIDTAGLEPTGLQNVEDVRENIISMDLDWDLENIQEMNMENIGYGINVTESGDDVVESNLKSPAMSFINEEVVEAEKEEGGRRRSNVNWVLIGMGLSVGIVSVGIIAGVIILTVKCLGKKKRSVRIEERA